MPKPLGMGETGVRRDANSFPLLHDRHAWIIEEPAGGDVRIIRASAGLGAGRDGIG
jgi:hypothetical protein